MSGFNQRFIAPQSMWAEDDFTLPPGVSRLNFDEPEAGRTYIMYHGTTRHAALAIQANGFQPSRGGMLGPGVYLSRDLQKASGYPIGLPEHGKVVLRVMVNVGKVIKISKQGHPYQKTWHHRGYDTAWVPPKCGMVKSDLEENCVWDPARITVLNIICPQFIQVEGTRNQDDYVPLCLGVACAVGVALCLLLGLKV